jgi:hypothetical protein
MTQLSTLNLGATKVIEKQITALSRALPRTKIIYKSSQ